MHEGLYLDLILAAIAGVLIYRLWAILGHRHGGERKRRWWFSVDVRTVREHPAKKAFARDESARKRFAKGHDAESDQANPDDPSAAGIPGTDASSASLARVLESIPSLDLERFLKGAALAFTVIVEAFSRGDSAALRELVSDEVFERFEAEIKRRSSEQSLQPTEVRSIISRDITRAWIADRLAYLEVKFVSQQSLAESSISLAKSFENGSFEGEDGSEDRSFEGNDIWVFSKSLASSDPNWLLTEAR